VDKHPLALVGCSKPDKEGPVRVRMSRIICSRRGGAFVTWMGKSPSYEGIDSSRNILDIQF
jgi:hypothetical protein